MSGDREWLRMAKPEHGRAGKARQPIQSRAPVGLTVLSRLREVARRAGNHVVQRYAEEEAFWAPAQVERAIDASQGGGSPIEHAVQEHMEGAFGADLSAVRIHNDADADTLSSALAARAFTRGSDIYFASGEYAPGTQEGQRLLAHELAHVQQQEDGSKLRVGAVADAAELEADDIADEVTQRLASGEARLIAQNVQRQQEPDDEEEAQGLRRQVEEEEEEEVLPE